MKTRLILLITTLLIFALPACNTPPQTPQGPSAVEPAAQSETKVVEVSTTQPPTTEPAQDAYPSPPAAAETGSTESGETAYPEPEAAAVSAAPTDYPAPTAADTDEVATGPTSAEVAITAPDELPLIGTFNTNGSGSPQPGVLLIHMLGGKRADWDAAGFTTLLNEEGYATLTLDLRGHGDSLSEVDWVLAESDMQVVWEWFVSQPEVDADNSVIIGASIGSNLALRTAASQPTVQAAVLLSPGSDYRGVTTEDVMAEIDRPVLLVAMDDDSYAAESVAALNAINPDHSTVATEAGDAHGTKMFGPFNGLETIIIDFLAQQLR